MSKIVKIGYDNEAQIRRKVSEVACYWKKGELNDGEPCVILSMYNPNAKSGSLSQALHITRDVAVQLIDLFNKELLNKK